MLGRYEAPDAAAAGFSALYPGSARTQRAISRFSPRTLAAIRERTVFALPNPARTVPVPRLVQLDRLPRRFEVLFARSTVQLQLLPLIRKHCTLSVLPHARGVCSGRYGELWHEAIPPEHAPSTGAGGRLQASIAPSTNGLAM